MEFVRHGYTTLTKYASNHGLIGEAYAGYMSEDVPLKDRINSFRDYNSMLSKEPIPSKLNHGLVGGALGAGIGALASKNHVAGASAGAVIGAAIGALSARAQEIDILNARQAAKMSAPQVRAKILREAALERRYNDARDRGIRATQAYNSGTRIQINNIR
jgi:hypothetical protein